MTTFAWKALREQPPPPVSAGSAEADNAIVSRRSPLKYFVLVFALSAPFWLIGAATGLQLSPGLPVSSLMVSAPVLAALVLVYRENRAAGMIALLKRAFDYRRIRGRAWYLAIVLLMPTLMVLSFGLKRLSGTSIPGPQFQNLAPIVMFLAFFVAGLGEELGWSGYVIDPMQRRMGALQASLLLGLLWGAWHVIPLSQAGRSPSFIAWQCLLFLVAQRVVIVWLYNNTGKSVFAAALFHAISNLGAFLFPINGSYYDPLITGLIMAFVAASVALVWGPQTLARFRKAGLMPARALTNVKP
jgi:membrane protease YdiL (CAAX protease family)